MTINLKYSLKSKVFISELNRGGTVLAFYQGDTGPQYSVRWFEAGNPQTAYFYEEDLAPWQDKGVAGFAQQEQQNERVTS